jgi:hypothetical protein
MAGTGCGAVGQAAVGVGGGTGQTGAAGGQGSWGAEGICGTRGAAGEGGDGATGPGITGGSGLAGMVGETGLTGVVGGRGPAGAPGARGPPGADGTPGADGEPGTRTRAAVTEADELMVYVPVVGPVYRVPVSAEATRTTFGGLMTTRGTARDMEAGASGAGLSRMGFSVSKNRPALSRAWS